MLTERSSWMLSVVAGVLGALSALAGHGVEAAVPSEQGSCWVRSAPMTVDVIAEQDPEWRERVYSKYELTATADGWLWKIKPGTGMLDSLAPGFAMPGMDMEQPPTELSVVHGGGSEQGQATHTIVWNESNVDRATIGWTLPPPRVCAGDVIDLQLWARIDTAPTVGEPVLREASFRFSDGPTGSDESLFEIGDACLRRRGTIALGGIAVGTNIGLEDAKRCRRALGPLESQSAWTLTVRLPEAFQVFYTYVRE